MASAGALRKDAKTTTNHTHPTTTGSTTHQTQPQQQQPPTDHHHHHHAHRARRERRRRGRTTAATEGAPFHLKLKDICRHTTQSNTCMHLQDNHAPPAKTCTGLHATIHMHLRSKLQDEVMHLPQSQKQCMGDQHSKHPPRPETQGGRIRTC